MELQVGDEVFIQDEIFTIRDVCKDTGEISVLDYNGLVSWKLISQIQKKI